MYTSEDIYLFLQLLRYNKIVYTVGPHNRTGGRLTGKPT